MAKKLLRVNEKCLGSVNNKLPKKYNTENVFCMPFNSSLTRLSTPQNLFIIDTKLYFSKVINAYSYFVYVDSNYYDYKQVTSGTNAEYLFYDEIAHLIPDTTNVTWTGPMYCGDGTEQFSSILIYGRNNHPDSLDKAVIYAKKSNNELVKIYEDSSTTASGWVEQQYRSIIFLNGSSAIGLPLLDTLTVYQGEEVEIDLEQLSFWNDLADGQHAVKLKAISNISGTANSFFSEQTTFGKNIGFLPHVIYGPYAVNRVVDGDTIEILVDSVKTKIRMIGVNTPESVASSAYRTKNCPEGKIASDYTKAQLNGKSVWIEYDEDPLDRYGRSLCYIYLSSSQTLNDMYNNQLISVGYGEAIYYSPNGYYRSSLETTQATAKLNRVGFWGTDFYPTKLEPPTVSISGSIITWNKYVFEPDNEDRQWCNTFQIKDGGTVVATFTQEVSSVNNQFDLSTVITTSGKHRINVVAVAYETTHTTSNNSNNVYYIV